ncbi:MAG: C25 family cysteine peptidase [bacterium]
MKTSIQFCFVILFTTALTILGGSNTPVAADKKKPHVTKNNNVMTFEYEFNEPEVSTEDDSALFTINGCERYSKAGEPVIPVMTSEILIPHGMKIAHIASTAIDTFQLPDTYKLPHGKKPFRRSKGKPDEPSEPDPLIFKMNDFWPGTYHKMLTIQSNRGYNIAYVNLFPLHYVPQTGTIKMARKLRLEIHFASMDTPHRTKPTKNLEKKLLQKIDNPATLMSYDTGSEESSSLPAKSIGESSPLSDPAGPYYGANYNYIVITNSFLANEANIPNPAYSFQALCASKATRDIAAGIVTTDWIVANYDGSKPNGGTDNATKIRNFLIDAYQTWGTEYTLLGGDKDIVPVRTFQDSDDSIPADLYYGCVDPPENTFDNDGDGKYGESQDGPEGDEVDLTAEIFIGRAAVENGQEVVNFVRKTLTYESTDNEYLNVAGTIGGYLGFGKIQEFTKPFGELIRLGSDLYLGHFTHGFESPNIPNARDFSVVTLYDEDWYNDNHEPDFDRTGSVDWNSYSDGWSATDDLLPLLNQENGKKTPQIIYISDHGDTSLGMVKLYTYTTGENKYNHLGNLVNTNYFFFYDDSCYVGSYDYNDCFGEEITTMEHGAFATILNSRYGWGSDGNNLDSPSTQFTREFFESVFGEGIFELGRAHQEAKESNLWRLYTSFWGIRYIYYELNLFGDPELQLRITKEVSCTEEDTQPTTCGTGACASTGIETCIDGEWGGDTCVPGTPSAEIFDGLDNDCNGLIDDGISHAPSIGGYNVYYGMLHSHTTISNGSGTPQQAYQYARDNGKLDFFGIADNYYYPDDMTDSDWSTIKNVANSYNDEGTFVTFWGFEWTSDSDDWQTNGLAQGHITIVNSEDYCISTYEPTRTLNQLVEWMSTRDVVAFFNHPGQYGTTFDKFEFNHSDKFVGMELWNRSTDYYSNDGYYNNDGGLGYYDEALSRGWYIGASGSQDNHDKTWGTMNEWRMAVLAPEKSRASIYAAMKARRFYSSRDKNLALSFKCNGAQMGSKIEGGSLNIQIEAFDGDNEEFSRIELLKNGAIIKTWTPNSTNPNVTHSAAGSEGDYFYVRVYQSSSWDAISSPIFITSGAVSNNPPVVTITEPNDSATFLPGDSITFTATAIDTEDGTICADCEWMSDHDGTIGSGCTFTITSLSENIHVITMSAEDSGGESDSDQITITIAEQGLLLNLILPASGGVLDSFSSEYGSGWIASDLTNEVTNEVGWSSVVNPGPQEFVYSFLNGHNATLAEAVVYGGTAEGKYYSKDVEVWTSADGAHYTMGGSGTLANSDNSIVTLDLGDTVAKTVKLVITSGYRNDYWELAEFEVTGAVMSDADVDADTSDPEEEDSENSDNNDNDDNNVPDSEVTDNDVDDDNNVPNAEETDNDADDDSDSETDEILNTLSAACFINECANTGIDNIL